MFKGLPTQCGSPDNGLIKSRTNGGTYKYSKLRDTAPRYGELRQIELAEWLEILVYREPPTQSAGCTWMSNEARHSSKSIMSACAKRKTTNKTICKH